MDVSNYPETLFLLSEKILKEEFVKDSSNINHMVKGIVLTNHTLRNFFFSEKLCLYLKPSASICEKIALAKVNDAFMINSCFDVF